MFERSAYGCKLYCCWCAQDIAANRFWEAMGFVPLAFRTGGEKKGPKGQARTHIFWQKRIRQGDATTPWWFPSKTAGGAIREDRIVLPIPPGTHWSDAKPMVLPTEVGGGQLAVGGEEEKRLNHGGTEGTEKKRRATKKELALSAPSLRSPCLRGESSAPPMVRRNGLSFDVPQPGEALPEVVTAANAKQGRVKTPKEKSPRVKRTCDPRLVSTARELRDRWLEEVNAGRQQLGAAPKYEIGVTTEGGLPAGRFIESTVIRVPQLAAA